jgi:hypothetical protein
VKRLAIIAALLLLLLIPAAQAKFAFPPRGAAASGGGSPVITFGAPSASYIYPSASGASLTTVTATVTAGSFLGGGGSFTSSNCAASNIAVASAGAVTVAGPSNLTGSQSCLITAQYPGATSVTQTFSLTGTQQTIASISSGGGCTLGGGCSYSFTPPATSFVLDTVPAVTMSGGISFAAGGGTIVLGAGLQCTDYAISGGSLQITAASTGTYACTYTITDSNASNSPQTPSISAVGGAGTNVIQVLIDNQNVPPSSAAGTHIGDLSAKVTGGGACSGCVYTMVNSGASSDGPTPVNCSASSNNFQIGTNGLTGNPDLEVLNASLTKRIYGGGSGTYPSTNPPVCVKATPSVGAAYTFPFSVQVRGPEITAVAPHSVQYVSASGTSVTLSANICWTDCQQAGSPPTPTFTLGADAACTAPGISISGSTLTLSSSYASAGICHITVAAAGVTCPQSGSLSSTPTTCVIGVDIEEGAYIGPGDATYRNGAPKLTWTTYAGIPRGYSAAYCASGTNPIWNVIRESDHQHFTANCLPSGDIDLIGLAAFCDKSMCVSDGPFVGGSNAEPDQSGHSPTNDMPAWGDHNSSNAITQWRPYVYFNVANGMPLWSNSNATDKFFYNPTTYNGSGATGTLWTTALSVLGGNYLVVLAAVNSGSNPVMYFGDTSTGQAGIYVGSQSGLTGGFTFTTAATSTGVLHSFEAAVGGTGANQSILQIDGAQTLGTLPLTASFAKPLGQDGEFGGGANSGFSGGVAISSSVASATPTTGQLNALCTFDSITFGISGACP